MSQDMFGADRKWLFRVKVCRLFRDTNVICSVMDQTSRIGIFLDTWDFGGIASFCLHLGNGLQERGYDVVLVLGTKCKPKDTAAAAVFRKMLAVKKFHVLDLQLNSIPRRDQNAYLKLEIQKLNFDLLILNNFTKFLPAFNALSAQVRMISVGHGDQSYSYNQFIAAQYFVHRHVAISREIFQTCSGICPPAWRYKIALCHHGVPIPPVYPLTVPEGPLRVVYCGRFDFTDKRLQDLPPVWKGFLRQGGQGRLTLIGDGEVRAWLQRQFEAETKAGTVRFLELLHGAELQAALCQEEIVLSLSNWEGLGMSVIEAVMAGCYPVLSDTRSGHREIIREIEGGVLSPIGDTEAFSTILLRHAVGRPELLSERDKIRQTAVQKFSLDRMIQGYDTLIAGALKEALGAPAEHLGIPSALKTSVWRNLFRKKPGFL